MINDEDQLFYADLRLREYRSLHGEEPWIVKEHEVDGSMEDVIEQYEVVIVAAPYSDKLAEFQDALMGYGAAVRDCTVDFDNNVHLARMKCLKLFNNVLTELAKKGGG